MSHDPYGSPQWPPHEGFPYDSSEWVRQQRAQTPPYHELVEGAVRAVQGTNETDHAADQPELSEPQLYEPHSEPVRVVTQEVAVYDRDFVPSFPLDPALRFGDRGRMRNEDYLPPVRWSEPVVTRREQPPALGHGGSLVLRHSSRHVARNSVAPYPSTPASYPLPTTTPQWNPVVAWNNVPPGAAGPTPVVTSWAYAPVVTSSIPLPASAWAQPSLPAWGTAPARPLFASAPPAAVLGFASAPGFASTPVFASTAAFSPAISAPVSTLPPQTSVSGSRVPCIAPGCSKDYSRASGMREHVRLVHPELAHLVETGRSWRPSNR